MVTSSFHGRCFDVGLTPRCATPIGIWLDERIELFVKNCAQSVWLARSAFAALPLRRDSFRLAMRSTYRLAKL